MTKKENLSRRWWSMLLALVMTATTVLGNVSLAVKAEDTFTEVTVPNGDFEDTDLENNAWNFTGEINEKNYFYKLYQNSDMSNNRSNIYEVCSLIHSDYDKVYTAEQTVTGLQPGTYKASIEATGGNDPGDHITTLTAGGKSVSVTPTAWNVWETYETDLFEVGEDGVCEILISSRVIGQYIDMDNVKLWRLDDGTGKIVSEVQNLTRKVRMGGQLTAPKQALVTYTDGSSAAFEVVWNEEELAGVDTTTEGTYLVNGIVTVEEEGYPCVLTVIVLAASNLEQVIAEDAEGSIDFDENWQFYLATRTPAEAEGGFAAAGLQDAGEYTTDEIIDSSFADSDWRTVDVPHDFSIEGEKTSSSVDSQAFLQGGLAYYRKTFTMPASMSEKKSISIDFEGVYQNCVVYLNGEEVGSYPNGYTGFAMDITDQVIYGGSNVLVVKVQNMSPSGRWYTGSGITRPVHLVVDNLAHLTRNGITLETPTLEEDYTGSNAAFLNVTASGYSDATNSNAYMAVTVYDADGNAVASGQTDRVAINPSTAFTLQLTDRNALEIEDVNLWYPWNLGTPYLYTVRTELYTEVNGSADGYLLTDVEETEYGFRWVEVKETTSDADSGGLYVNGEYTKVQGVDLHHDAGSLGAASFTDAYDRQFDKLINMGVNAYRTSHCPPSRQAIEVCRRKGILVVEEAFDGWGTVKASYDFGRFFLQSVPAEWAGLKPNGYTSVPRPSVDYDGAEYTWSDWVIQEMVNRDKNEPSIIAWSIGNEVRGVGSQPSWYQTTQYDTLDVNPSRMDEYTEAVRLLNDIDTIDGTRYVLMGGDQERSVPNATSTWGLVNQVLDGYGLNYNTAASVDGLINRYSLGDSTLLKNATKTFFFESESSSQTSSRGVYLDPQFTNTGTNQTPGSRGGSNYDNDFASWTMSNEYGLKKDRDRKSFIGQFIWTGFDYLGEPTPYSVYPVGVASFGTIDTAGFEKDSFYLYQSQWVDEPMVHLLPQNWDEWETGENVEVWVNTNVQTAELFLNGESLGTKSFDEKQTAYGKTYYETSEKTSDDKTWGDSSNAGGYTSKGAVVDGDETNYGKLHLTWSVPYEAGTLEVRAYDKEGNVVATDSVTTSGAAYTIQAEADKTVLTADGSSLSYVECTVVDADGNMVADASDYVNFDIEGAATIVGVDNGQQESTELYKYGNTDSSKHSERSAYNGKVLVIVKSEKEAGAAVLTISAEDLKPVIVNFNVTEDGTGNAPAQTEVTGTAVAAEEIAITVPEGVEPTLPSSVRVHYTSEAGDYTLMRQVTWSAVENGQAAGTIAGETITAAAVINQDSSMTYGEELATNILLGTGNSVFDFKALDAESEEAKKALATASFTGSTANYPNNMLDGDNSTSWTNAYLRNASVLLPANSASRASEYVTFYWNSAKVMNQVGLTFVESRYCAIPDTLTVEYWNGTDWQKAADQTTIKQSDAPTVVQFAPVYTDRVRVYMVNATPFTSAGNIEITEASVKLADPKGMGTQIGLTSETTKVEAGKSADVTADLTYIPADTTIKEIRFVPSYDSEVFDAPVITLADGVPGVLTSDVVEGITVYTYTSAEGSSPAMGEFLKITVTAKENALRAATRISLGNLTAKDSTDAEISIDGNELTLEVIEPQIIGDVTYLSDMEWKSATSGWQTVNKDLNCNGADSSGIALKVSGEKQSFKKGLGACADSEIIYELTAVNASLQEKEKLYFQSYVGVDYFKIEQDKSGGDGMYFIVYCDGEERYKTNLMGIESNAEFISLDVTGISELKLVMDKNASNSHDNGDWADAKLIKVPDPDAVMKNELVSAIKTASELPQEGYTAESYEALRKVMEEARAVADNPDATQEEVDEQVAKITQAVSALKVPNAADYQEVLKQLEKAQSDLKEAQEAAEKAKAEAEAKLKQAQAEAEALRNQLAALQSGETIKAGDTVTVSGVKYRVTDAEKKLAEAYGVDTKSKTTVKVAATVKIGNTTCKVTAVAKSAFKNMKKLKSVVIGKNVTSIGASAFSGDKNLKKIIVKGKGLKSVGKRALKGISAKAVIKVPSAKKKAYTALFKGKGQKKTVKVK